MFKYLKPNLISSHQSYSVEKICALYESKKLHPQTIRAWVKSGDLEAVTQKPLLIYGEVLKNFLILRNAGNKKTLDFKEFKCFTCKENYNPNKNEITMYHRKNGSLNATSMCGICGRENSRFYKKIDEPKLREIFVIKQPAVTTICNSSGSNTKTHINELKKEPPCEPQNQTDFEQLSLI